MRGGFPHRFEREMGCTEADLRAQLAGASRGAPIAWRDNGADVTLAQGTLSLRWRTLPPRRIALITLPRLALDFQFGAAIDADARADYMRYFDLYTQRGGG